MTSIRLNLVIAFISFCASQAIAQALQPIHPVGFDKVNITDAFWRPKIETVATVTLPVCVEQTEIKTPRIRNFEKVARRQGEKHEGIYFDDSDVYKALEAIAYSLKNHPDQTLERTADSWIDKIAAAQQPDGYLNTYYTLSGIDKRWTDMEKHEDYCAGHLIEAGVAYYHTTGKRKLLDVAIRFADHIDNTFRKQNKHWVSGHQEIELALVKLYHTTNDKKYLELSDWFLQQRGHGYGKGVIWDQWKNPDYCQDGIPVKDQKEITGHAVRAMYLYTGAADVASATNDAGYLKSMSTVWEDVVYRNMYITGGIGSSGKNEGFTNDYDLPNDDAYCETCASVGMVFWNQRMNLLTGDSKYIDVLERSLYNGALDGLSQTGDRFFYGNPLTSTGGYSRSAWFGTACCPSNISRLVASLGDYIYATTDNSVYVNLFVASNTSVPFREGNMSISQQSNYPWEGVVKITLSPDKKMKKTLRVRIPGWAQNNPVPGKTYSYLNATTDSIKLSVNGKAIAYNVENGYAVIERTWKKGEVIDLTLPMTVKRVVASEDVKNDVGQVALQRGPLVYCIEHPDNDGKILNIILPDKGATTTSFRPDLLGGVVVINSQAAIVRPTADGSGVETVAKEITSIPYYTWANRGEGEMRVWVPRRVKDVVVE